MDQLKKPGKEKKSRISVLRRFTRHHSSSPNQRRSNLKIFPSLRNLFKSSSTASVKVADDRTSTMQLPVQDNLFRAISADRLVTKPSPHPIPSIHITQHSPVLETAEALSVKNLALQKQPAKSKGYFQQLIKNVEVSKQSTKCTELCAQSIGGRKLPQPPVNRMESSQHSGGISLELSQEWIRKMELVEQSVSSRKLSQQSLKSSKLAEQAAKGMQSAENSTPEIKRNVFKPAKLPDVNKSQHHSIFSETDDETDEKMKYGTKKCSTPFVCKTPTQKRSFFPSDNLQKISEYDVSSIPDHLKLDEAAAYPAEETTVARKNTLTSLDSSISKDAWIVTYPVDDIDQQGDVELTEAAEYLHEPPEFDDNDDLEEFKRSDGAVYQNEAFEDMEGTEILSLYDSSDALDECDYAGCTKNCKHLKHSETPGSGRANILSSALRYANKFTFKSSSSALGKRKTGGGALSSRSSSADSRKATSSRKHKIREEIAADDGPIPFLLPKTCYHCAITEEYNRETAVQEAAAAAPSTSSGVPAPPKPLRKKIPGEFQYSKGYDKYPDIYLVSYSSDDDGDPEENQAGVYQHAGYMSNAYR